MSHPSPSCMPQVQAGSRESRQTSRSPAVYAIGGSLYTYFACCMYVQRERTQLRWGEPVGRGRPNRGVASTCVSMDNAQSDREKRISNGGGPGSAADSSRGGELGRGEQERRSSRGSARGLPTRGKEGEGASGKRVSRRPRGRARPPTGSFREGSPKVPSSSLEHALPALRSKGQPRRPLGQLSATSRRLGRELQLLEQPERDREA